MSHVWLDKSGNDKNRKKGISTQSGSDQEEEYIVGMRAEVKADGIFKDQHEVGKFVAGKVGQIKSLRVTRGGLVIFECADAEQFEKAMRISTYGKWKCPVNTFRMREKQCKGVVCGVSLSVNQKHSSAT